MIPKANGPEKRLPLLNYPLLLVSKLSLDRRSRDWELLWSGAALAASLVARLRSLRHPFHFSLSEK